MADQSDPQSGSLKGAFVVREDPDDPRDIKVSTVSAWERDIPEDQAALRDEIDRALTVLRGLFPEGDQRFREYFRSLLSLAQAGLVGPAAQPRVARRALRTWKADIVAREAGRVKNSYLRHLGWRALIFGVVPLGVLPLERVFGAIFWPDLGGFLYLWAGCMGGVWLSFGIRKRVLEFEELHTLEEDRLDPSIRLVFTGLLAVTFGLLLHLGIVTIEIGSVGFGTFASNHLLAILIGILLGITEKNLPSRIATQASGLLDKE